jgi:hypothetical protein
VHIRSAAFGPAKIIPQTQEVLVSSAWYSSNSGNVFFIGNEGVPGPSTQQGACVELVCLGDGSLRARQGVSRGNGTLGTSAPGIITFNTYNQVALQCTVALAGTVKVWCNGVLVLNLVGVDTRNAHNFARTYIDAVQLMAPGGTPTCFHDDVFVLDCTVAPNNSFPGGFPRIYAAAPFADGAPIQWTPLGGGTHFSEVDEIPPDGDTSYVSSATVGQRDQYQYNATGVPASAQILAVQHNLDMKVDSGARTVASAANGIAATGDAITANYHDYTTPWDTNPATGLQWQGADFPAQFGPEVTA